MWHFDNVLTHELTVTVNIAGVCTKQSDLNAMGWIW